MLTSQINVRTTPSVLCAECTSGLNPSSVFASVRAGNGEPIANGSGGTMRGGGCCAGGCGCG
jgi:hypothetical protein